MHHMPTPNLGTTPVWRVLGTTLSTFQVISIRWKVKCMGTYRKTTVWGVLLIKSKIKRMTDNSQRASKYTQTWKNQTTHKFHERNEHGRTQIAPTHRTVDDSTFDARFDWFDIFLTLLTNAWLVDAWRQWRKGPQIRKVASLNIFFLLTD